MIIEATAMAIAKKVFEKVSPSALSAAANATSQTIDKARVKYTNVFQDHLQKTLSRVQSAKTVISRDQPVNLLDIYVNLDLKSDERECADNDVVDQVGTPCRIFIYGTGGAGKTMMMKYIILRSFMDPKGVIPIFLEFRNLLFKDCPSFEKAAFEYIVGKGAKQSEALFRTGLESGLFVLFVDGLDEVGRDVRDHAVKLLGNFASAYPATGIIISSRPGFSPQSLEAFTAYGVQGLTMNKAISVVEKTLADECVKQEFIKQLRDGLYKKHDTFLQVPLLVVMMLLTFGSYADIPDRMTVFYEQAFETLYALHDTTSKGPFKRQHFAGLSPDLFRQLFEAFCYMTLSRDKFSFIFSELIDFVARASAVSQIEVDANLIQKDLEESVCLVQQDGIKYVFVHRSFQEFFASKFALRYGGSNQFEIINNIIGRDYQNNTVTMMNEIDAVKFKEKWILPALDRVAELMGSVADAPVDERLAQLIGGFHVEMGTRAKGVVPEIAGWLLAQDKLARDLTMALSRVTNIRPHYSLWDDLDLLPRQKGERERFIAKLSSLPPDMEDVLVLMDEADDELAEHGELLGSCSVHAKAANREWLELLGLGPRMDAYLEEIKQELGDIRLQVARQRELELEIL